MFQKWLKKFEKYKKEDCEYCCKGGKLEIKGKEFKLKPTTGFKNDRVYSCWIMKCKEDKKAGIMIATDGTNGVYADIDYCPFCGRKIGD